MAFPAGPFIETGNPLHEGFRMPKDTSERTELHRMADDGCPQASDDTMTIDVRELWARLGQQDE